MEETASKDYKKPTKIEISAGGVVINKNTKKFLLIKDSYGRWALPKGKIEKSKNETPKEAAMREIFEETGIKNTSIIGSLGKVKYFFCLKKQPIYKIVYNFLLETEQEDLKPNFEIKDAKWFEQDEAIVKISYKNAREIVNKASKIIRGQHETTK